MYTLKLCIFATSKSRFASSAFKRQIILSTRDNNLFRRDMVSKRREEICFVTHGVPLFPARRKINIGRSNEGIVRIRGVISPTFSFPLSFSGDVRGARE